MGEGGGGDRDCDDEDNAKSVATTVPHELERVEEQMAQQERRMRRVELGRPRTPEPTCLGMTHLTTNNTDAEVEAEAEVETDHDEGLRPRSSPTTTRDQEQEQQSVAIQLFERLNSLS